MIVGTAGHVDHGKTTLVRALTGVDTDRLAEEKRRGITIDLGFAYMRDAADGTIGFVDVPGHESLVRTMVAGAAGIDFALLVVAADEGIMPQTREHLDILGLLAITDGIVAVTKSDRADAARRTAVMHELTTALEGTVFAGKPPIFVSATNGEGMDRLRAELLRAAATDRSRRVDRIFRLAVDRAFTLKGVGTVVAGTTISGRIAMGDETTIVPEGRRARVRSLHVQNAVATEGHAGLRCALALAGVPHEAVARGDWICGEAEPATSARIDVDLRLLAGERRGIGQGTPVHLHCGASDVPARVVALSADMLMPGARGFAQILAAAPLPFRHGDRFVLRDTSAQRTIGGGCVVDPRGPKRKRRAPERLQRLVVLSESDPTAALKNVLSLRPHVEDLGVFAADRSLTLDAAETLAAQAGLVVCRDADSVFVTTPEQWQALADAVPARLASIHAESPELPGLAGERLRLLLEPAVPRPLFMAVRNRLLGEGRIELRGPYLCLPTHVAQLGAEDQRIADLLLPLVARDRFRPPRVRDIGGALAFHETNVRRACKALVRTGALVEIAKDHFFLHETVAEMAGVAQDLTEHLTLFSAADFRDRLDNGRKVAIQILEFFDREGLTRRDGDLRRVVKAPDALFGTAAPQASDAA